ncbi:PaaI family thioesterase [Brevirhabdus sp.]|uniref:PaaI family thioesterase n=1 Tax=Brevirhabdus sp. TaxID=2004514 RepID=UPI00405824EB
MSTLKMTRDELMHFLVREFPQVADDFAIEALSEDGIQLRLLVQDRHLRPGGTVSGPSMFALADVAIYLSLLSRIGPVALAATTSLSMDFMRRPGPVDVIAHARLLKIGRRLAVGDAMMFSRGLEPPVARASMTYAIPPR